MAEAVKFAKWVADKFKGSGAGKVATERKKYV